MLLLESLDQLTLAGIKLKSLRAELGGCLYSPRIREEVFSESGLPASDVLGTSKGSEQKKKAGAP